MENSKNTLPNKLNLLLFLSFIIISFQLFNIFSNSKDDLKVNYIKKEIKILKDDISNIYKYEKSLDKKIDTFNIQIQNIHEAKIINNTKIKKLKKDEKIQTDKFKSYDVSMWESYFTNRYSKKQ